MVGELNYRKMTIVLEYLAIDVITMYETNIKQHFTAYVERFVNVSWEKSALVAIIKKHKTTRGKRPLPRRRTPSAPSCAGSRPTS